MSNGFFKQNVFGIVALAVVLGFVGFSLGTGGKSARKIAFVDTQRLLVGFGEAHKVNKELQAEDAAWRQSLKGMEDSLKAYMDTMTAKYDKADAKGKADMQNRLALFNQELAAFERVNTKKMQDMTNKRMAGIYDKINAFMKEYGTARGHDVIFGTVQGSILFGEGTPADITNEVVAQLNKRYE